MLFQIQVVIKLVLLVLVLHRSQKNVGHMLSMKESMASLLMVNVKLILGMKILMLVLRA